MQYMNIGSICFYVFTKLRLDICQHDDKFKLYLKYNMSFILLIQKNEIQHAFIDYVGFSKYKIHSP